jgi:hypothetical protein
VEVTFSFTAFVHMNVLWGGVCSYSCFIFKTNELISMKFGILRVNTKIRWASLILILIAPVGRYLSVQDLCERIMLKSTLNKYVLTTWTELI